jgi:two-component system chemotaxis response regulator CheY
MVSTEAQERDQILAFAAGANYYVTKPAKAGHLAAVATLLTGGGFR